MKLWIRLAAFAVLSISLIGGAWSQAKPGTSIFPTRQLTIATGTKGTAYNLVGLEMARQIKILCPACDVKVVETAGGVENLAMLRNGRADIAFANASASWEASIDADQFKANAVTLRTLAALYPNSMHVVARLGADIKSLKQLKGKRVATGAKGSGTEVIANQMLLAVDINPDTDIKRSRLGLSDAVKAMRAGEIDAFIFGAAVPVKSIEDLLKEGQSELISSAESIKGMTRIYGHMYRVGRIPVGTYSQQALEVKPLDVWDLVMVADSMPGQLAFELTKNLFENRAAYISAHPNMQYLELTNQPLHATVSHHLGAQKYYASKGLQPFARQLNAASKSVTQSVTN
jgi:TRAP transporter TAXI family solute receptor